MKIEKAKGIIEEYTGHRFFARCPYCGEMINVSSNVLRYKCHECNRIFDIEWKYIY